MKKESVDRFDETCDFNGFTSDNFKLKTVLRNTYKLERYMYGSKSQCWYSAGTLFENNSTVVLKLLLLVYPLRDIFSARYPLHQDNFFLLHK